MTNEKKFYELANEITSNPEGYVRKVSDEDIEAYESGEDDFGDIVWWAERQLDMSENVNDWIKDSDETEEDWFGYEAECLESLILQNRKKED